MGLEGVGKLADAGEQLTVAGAGHGAIVGLKNNRSFMLCRRAHVPVKAVGRGIEFAVVKPFVKGRGRLVERPGKGLGPNQVLARQAGPKTLKIMFSLCTQGMVGGHAGNSGALDHRIGGREHAVFNQQRLDSRGWFAHGLVSFL